MKPPKIGFPHQPVVDVIKLNLDFPKIKKLNIVCSDIETCTKM